MGKKVTYGIEYSKKPNIAKVVKEHITKYKNLLSEKRSTEAAETVINITEWVLDVSDEADDPEDEEILHYLSYVIKYSKSAVKLLKPEEHFELLTRAHNNMCLCYLKLNLYSSSIQHGLIALSLFSQRPLSQMKSNVQNAYKIIGDVYFTKSLNKLESRFSDFENAHKYYSLEKQVIDTMDLSDMEEPGPDDLKKLKQASHFNLGVMESKIPRLHMDAENNLKEAVMLAHRLNDSVAERSAWWELGNLYKSTGQHDDNVAFCQHEEFKLAKKCEFKEDMFYCFEEKLKFLLYLEKYDECFKFYEENIRFISSTYIRQCHGIYNMIKTLKSAKEELSQMIDSEYGNEPTTTTFIDYIQILNDYDLYRLVIKKVDEYLSLFLAASDYSAVMHAEFLKYKSIALWTLRESKRDVYIRTTDELLTFIEASLTTKKLDQLSLTIEILKLRVEIFKFYEKKIQRDACKKLLVDTIEEEKKLKESFLKNSSMEISTGISNRITPLYNGFEPKALHVLIHTYIPIEISIRYDVMPRSVKQVINDITKKCWLDHGVEPIITHLFALGQNIYPKDDIECLMQKNSLRVEAFSKEIVQKTPLQLYHNAASRLEIDQLSSIKSRLFKQNSTHLILDNLNLGFDQKHLIKPLLQHSTLLLVLDLSSNYLDDQDLKVLFESAPKDLIELNLRNNLLTVDCLSSILLFPQLRVLDLSYNALGPGILQRLPYLLENLTSLKHIKLSSTHLGDYIKLDQEVKEAYISYAMTSNNKLPLLLDISNNHFYKDMLCNWTTLWINLNRITRLYLSNISSDTEWVNFRLLSDLPNLSDLIFSFSSKRSLHLCGIQQLITLKPELNHLDLSNCNLTAEHIEIISQTLQESTTKLGKLTLHFNPRIGDRGIYFLNGAILQSKINMLDISNCGLTNECITEIVQWTHYVEAIDWTGNNLVLSGLDMERIKKSTNVKLEKVMPDCNKLMDLPDTPF